MGKPDRFRQLLEMVLERVGRSPRQRLAWAVREAQKSPQARTSADWDNLRSELAVFSIAGIGGAAGDRDGSLFRPTQDETKPILVDLSRMIAAAVSREPVSLGQRLVQDQLVWDAKTDRYTTMSLAPPRIRTTAWAEKSRRALARLLEANGHLVKECPAPEPRKATARCGLWFVGNRPRQAYCSPRCQSRAATQTYRKKQETKTRRKQ